MQVLMERNWLQVCINVFDSLSGGKWVVHLRFGSDQFSLGDCKELIILSIKIKAENI